jgi:diacylglycerol kinase family enzyme
MALTSRQYFASIYYLEKDKNIDISKYSINSDLDDNFTKLSDEFKFLWMFNVNWLSSTIHGAPKTNLEDGLFDAMLFKGGRKELMTLLNDQDLSHHFNNEIYPKPNLKFDYCLSKYYRIIPKLNLSDDDSISFKPETKFQRYFDIDGERYNVEPVDIKTLQKVFKIFN